MLFQNFVEVFKRLFGVKPRTTGTEQAENTAFAERYEDVREVNLTAWAAGKIANMVVSDSDITVTGEGARAQLLNGALQACVKRLKNIMTRVFAVGGVVLKPYLHGGRLYTDILPQNRFINIEQVGDVITAAGFVAEAFTRDCKAYVRTEYHRLADGVYTIEQRATVNGQPVALAAVPQWAGIAPVVAISGVRQMLFGIITCPADGRKQMNDIYGVPITYGQDKLMGEITELLDAFQREFKNKEAFIGVSDLLFDGKNKLPGDGVYKKFRDDEGDFFEVFSPDIRAQAYIDGINYRLELLEKAIGVNKGVLTNLATADATATAIRRSTFDTWALVDDARTGVEAGIGQLVYAFDVYANAAQLAPAGGYELTFDWDYTLLEDTAERFGQLQTGVEGGYIAPWEARAWVMDETPEQAKRGMPAQPALGVDANGGRAAPPAPLAAGGDVALDVLATVG